MFEFFYIDFVMTILTLYFFWKKKEKNVRFVKHQTVVSYPNLKKT